MAPTPKSPLSWWVWLIAVLVAAAGCSDEAATGTTTADPVPGATDSDLGVAQDADAESQGSDSEAEPDTALPGSDVSGGDLQLDIDGSGGGACPGGPTCACAADSECDSGVCLETSDGKQCAKLCSDGSCPGGFACKVYGAADQISVCVPLHLTICAPCVKNQDCQVQGANDAFCLDRGDEGAFCGGSCSKDSECPDGYLCSEGKPVGGGAAVKACQPKGGALCSCSVWATKAGVATPCKTSNSYGSCGGKRSCAKDGLSACDAPPAKAEVCNSLDDNCNGKIDDLNAGAACFKKAFDSKGSDQPCSADGDCPAGEGCNGGKCRVLIGACPGKASCTSAGEEICLDAKTPSYETCNGQDDDCDGLSDEAFSWVDLAGGGTVAIGQPCGTGSCSGGTVQCQTINQATCSTAAKAGKDSCNGQDDDCDGQTDESACDDGDPCSSDACDPVKAACEHSAAVDCDDQNPCTNDSCDKGSGGCQHKLAAGISCSDANACTIGDSCGNDASGLPSCLPGANPAKCDDGNLCTDDSCAPDKGCVALANAATQACYEGPSGTAGQGVCHGGQKICKDGQLGGCVDQTMPAAKEACDGLDDDCDGLTDEICKGDTWQGGLVAIAGGGTGSATVVALSAGGPSPVGELQATGASALWAGFMRWLAVW